MAAEGEECEGDEGLGAVGETVSGGPLTGILMGGGWWSLGDSIRCVGSSARRTVDTRSWLRVGWGFVSSEVAGEGSF